jgi:LysM repeat protein
MSYRALAGYLTLALAALIAGVMVIFAIRVLTQDPPKPPEPKTNQPYYRVRPGDALASIALKTGVPLEQLRELNPTVDPLGLRPRQRIRLRASAPPLNRRRPRKRGPRRRIYVVKKGDTLSGIVEKTDVPLYQILEVNRGIRPNTLVPGQRIKLRH